MDAGTKDRNKNTSRVRYSSAHPPPVSCDFHVGALLKQKDGVFSIHSIHSF